MHRGHRVEGAFSFSVAIDINKLPRDFPFDYSDSVHWSIEAHRVFDDLLNWRSVEVGEPIDVHGEHGQYKGFEIFGPTPRGSALRLSYTEEQLAWIDRRLDGIVSSPTHRDAESDVRDIKDAFLRVNPAYSFAVHKFRKYP